MWRKLDVGPGAVDLVLFRLGDGQVKRQQRGGDCGCFAVLRAFGQAGHCLFLIRKVFHVSTKSDADCSAEYNANLMLS